MTSMYLKFKDILFVLQYRHMNIKCLMSISSLPQNMISSRLFLQVK